MGEPIDHAAGARGLRDTEAGSLVGTRVRVTATGREGRISETGYGSARIEFAYHDGTGRTVEWHKLEDLSVGVTSWYPLAHVARVFNAATGLR